VQITQLRQSVSIFSHDIILNSERTSNSEGGAIKATKPIPTHYICEHIVHCSSSSHLLLKLFPIASQFLKFILPSFAKKFYPLNYVAH
jgi:hypothetical protein